LTTGLLLVAGADVADVLMGLAVAAVETTGPDATGAPQLVQNFAPPSAAPHLVQNAMFTDSDICGHASALQMS